MVELNLKYPEEAGKCPRLNQCYLCKAWQLEKNLSPVEVPDQVGWIEKKACQHCLAKILDEAKQG
jgi:hypothetical protein